MRKSSVKLISGNKEKVESKVMTSGYRPAFVGSPGAHYILPSEVGY